jgi:hypothetical protein
MPETIFRLNARYRGWQLPEDGTLSDAPAWVAQTATAGLLVNVQTHWMLTQGRPGHVPTKRAARFGDWLLQDTRSGEITPHAPDVLLRYHEPDTNTG